MKTKNIVVASLLSLFLAVPAFGSSLYFEPGHSGVSGGLSYLSQGENLSGLGIQGSYSINGVVDIEPKVSFDTAKNFFIGKSASTTPVGLNVTYYPVRSLVGLPIAIGVSAGYAAGSYTGDALDAMKIGTPGLVLETQTISLGLQAAYTHTLDEQSKVISTAKLESSTPIIISKYSAAGTNYNTNVHSEHTTLILGADYVKSLGGNWSVIAGASAATTSPAPFSWIISAGIAYQL